MCVCLRADGCSFATLTKVPRRCGVSAVTAALCALLTSTGTPAWAVANNWIGTSGSFWDIAANWSGGLPTAISDAGLATFSTVFRSGSVTVQSFSGTGTLSITGGSLSATGASSMGIVALSGGALSTSAAAAFGSLNLSAGILGGTGTQTIGGSSTWIGSGALSGAGTTEYEGALALNGIGNTRTITGRTVNFNGTTTWTNTGAFGSNLGQINVSNGATLNNSGTWNDQTNFNTGIFASGAASTFNNLGTYSKTGTNNTDIQIAFNNMAAGAAVSVGKGTLSLGGGGSLSGSVDVTNGALLNLYTNTFALSGLTAQAGTGTLQVGGSTTNASGTNAFGGTVGITAGTLNVAGSFGARGLSMSGGTLGGAGTISASTASTWVGAGTMTGSGVTNFSGSLDLNGIGNTRTITGRTVNFNGTTTWTNTGAFGSNLGQINVSNGATLNNSGTWNDQTNFNTGIFASGTASTFNNLGTYSKTGTTVTNVSGVAFNNPGTVDVRAGTLVLPAAFNNTGIVMGSGTVQATTFTNSGHVAPGESPGTLSVTGNFAQPSSGILDIEIENLTSFDLLRITGMATLGGTLNLICFGNCALAIGHSFTVLDALASADSSGLVGSFTSVTYSGFEQTAFAVSYDRLNGDVLLNVTAVPEPASWAMLAAGLLTLSLLLWRRQRHGR